MALPFGLDSGRHAGGESSTAGSLPGPSRRTGDAPNRAPGLTADVAAGDTGGDAAWVTARLRGELRSNNPCGSHPGLPMTEGNRISKQDLRDFLEERADELDSVAVDLPRVIGITEGWNGEKN